MKNSLLRVAVAAVTILAVLSPEVSEAQNMPERRLVRKGNRQFKREQYGKSIESYSRAVGEAPASFEAIYDLSNALFRAERYDKAEQTLAGIVNDSTRTDIERSEAVYNLGNTQFAQQKLQQALESYRQAMRLNPKDMEAKYNYAYTKKLLQQQQDQQNQDQNKDDQNKEQNQDQNKDQNKDQNQNQDQNQNKDNNRDQNQNDQNKDQNQNRDNNGGGNDDRQQGGENRSGISQQQQEAMLDAIQAQEDKTQEKLKEKAGVIVRGNKNW